MSSDDEIECVAGLVDIRCPPDLYDYIWLSIGLGSILAIIYIVIVIEFLLAPLKDKFKLYFRILLVVAAQFEVIFAVLHPISIYFYTNTIIGTIARVLPWFVYGPLTACCAIIEHGTMRAIYLTLQSSSKDVPNKMSKILIYGIYIFLALIPILGILSFVFRLELFEDIFYAYMFAYVSFGCLCVFGASYKVRNKLKELLKSAQHKAKHNLPEISKHVVKSYNSTSEQSETKVNEMGTIKMAPKLRRMKHKGSDSVEQLKQTIKQLNFICVLTGIILIFCVLSLINLIFGIIREWDAKLNWYAPYSSILSLLPHYVIIMLLFIGLTHYIWIPIPLPCNSNTVSNDTIWTKINDKCCSNPKKTNKSLDPMLNGGYQLTVNGRGGHVKNNSGDNDDENMLNDNNNNNNNNNNDSSILMHSQTAGSIKVKLSLDRITDEGRKKGKKNLKRPAKVGKIDAERNAYKSGKNWQSNTVDKYETKTSVMTGLNGHEPISVLPSQLKPKTEDEKLNEMLEMYSDIDHNTSLIIYEFENVICTQIKKLKKKMENFITNRTSDECEYFLGGNDRVNNLIKHFKTIIGDDDDGNYIYKKKNNNKPQPMLFCLTEEYSKMVVLLFRKVGIEDYFESEIGNRKLSHVIGWESKLIQDTNNKKHLIILKLIQYLKREHGDVLYISHNKETIKHLQSINICKTYFVKTNGMTTDDLNKINKTFFDKQ